MVQFVKFEETDEFLEIEDGKGNKAEISPLLRKGHTIYNLDFTVADFSKIIKPINFGGKARLLLWEAGGGYTNTGRATVICGVDGSPLKPLFVRTRGHLACGEHALFGIWEGTPVVKIATDKWRNDYSIRIEQLSLQRNNEGFYFVNSKIVWQIDETNKEKIHEDLPKKYEKYQAAILAAMEKANCYHCREPHYTKKPF